VVLVLPSFLFCIISSEYSPILLTIALSTCQAYQELGILVANGEISERAQTIATFALCGFANPGSIGIQLGGLGALAPERKKDLAQVVLRAFISGCVASLLNACVAGCLIA
jgi:nucleoside permease NupC